MKRTLARSNVVIVMTNTSPSADGWWKCSAFCIEPPKRTEASPPSGPRSSQRALTVKRMGWTLCCDRSVMTESPRLTKLSLAAVLVGALALHVGASGTTNGQWRMYSADNAATKYSPLDQINKANVGRLKVAWR